MNNYLYPFFWLHGEDHAILTEYIEKIEESGMKGLCIESRPHPDFVGEGWWKDVDYILSEVKQRQMKLWILDDSHFPTGFANGKVKEAFPEYLKVYINMRRYDIQGDGRKIRIDFPIFKGRPWDRPDPREKVLGVYMANRMSQRSGDGDAIDTKTLVDITSAMEGRLLTLEQTPKGAYSIFVVYITPKGGEEATADYLNPLVKEATQVLIDEVYEPHFAHYGEEFGKTIQGFFSDEPRFGNMKGTDWQIGAEMPLPWRLGLEQELPFEMRYLPLLWTLAGTEKEIMAEVRYGYMDLITRLYNENFTQVLGDWCRAHGVAYLGHTIEDNGAHARLGYGTGHYFRGQEGMDFAGIDTIGGQIVPGMNYHHDAFNTGGSNGEFYHYALGKLASSAAHLDPKKKGRVMCEAFGAYGWNEGIRMMTWIANHLLSRGVNYIVPHAFNPKEFPDFDCPPHFYAHGHNPEFRYFETFSNYVNRVATIFSDGQMPAKLAVLYPAEQEWAGDYIPLERITRVLTEYQISYEIVTLDHLRHATYDANGFQIYETKFTGLVVGDSAYQPGDMAEILKKVSHAASVYTVVEREDQVDAKKLHLDTLGQKMQEAGYACVRLSQQCPDLVVYSYEKEGRTYWMFFNENIGDAIDVDVTLQDVKTGNAMAETASFFRYDAWKGQTSPISTCHLHLQPYEAVFWVQESDVDTADDVPAKDSTEWEQVAFPQDGWKVTFADSFAYPNFETPVETTELGCISDLAGWENRAGTICYQQNISIAKKDNVRYILELGQVAEVAEVYIEETLVDTRICEPYVFDITEAIRDGENKVRIEVTNSLGTEQRDVISHYLPIESFGILGEVKLWKGGK